LQKRDESKHGGDPSTEKERSHPEQQSRSGSAREIQVAFGGMQTMALTTEWSTKDDPCWMMLDRFAFGVLLF
jgi:hypothetical protein